MNKRKRLIKTKAQQRFHCFCGVGVLVVTRLLFELSFAKERSLRKPLFKPFLTKNTMCFFVFI